MFNWKYARRSERREIVILTLANIIGWIVIFWLALDELCR